MIHWVAMLGAMAPPGRRVLRTHESGGDGASKTDQLEPVDSHKLRALLLRKKGKRDWQAACDTLWWAVEQQPNGGGQVQPIHFNIVLASLAAATEWERCLVLLEHDMPSAGLAPDSNPSPWPRPHPHHSPFTAHHSPFTLTLTLILTLTGLAPDSYSYSSAISACAKAKPAQPGHAISLFKHMCAAGVEPNVITCNTVRGTHSNPNSNSNPNPNGPRPQLSPHPSPNLSPHPHPNQVLSACQRAKQPHELLAIFGAMASLGPAPAAPRAAAPTCCSPNVLQPATICIHQPVTVGGLGHVWLQAGYLCLQP